MNFWTVLSSISRTSGVPSGLRKRRQGGGVSQGSTLAELMPAVHICPTPTTSPQALAGFLPASPYLLSELSCLRWKSQDACSPLFNRPGRTGGWKTNSSANVPDK